jgi:hypothetical protein
MKDSTSQVSGFRFWAAVLACVLLIATLLPLIVQAAPPAALPPLPPLPQSSGRRSQPAGCFIKLHVQFPPAWPWAQVHWQELWTSVQWQDAGGEWHAVEGWQGTLDGVRLGDGDAPIGEPGLGAVPVGDLPGRGRRHRPRQAARHERAVLPARLHRCDGDGRRVARGTVSPITSRDRAAFTQLAHNTSGRRS